MTLYLQIFFTSLAFSFGILHLILYIYNTRFKSNLFFSIFLFLYALNIFFDYQASLASSFEESLIFLRIHRGVVPYNPIFALLFIYYAFDVKIPKHFWLIVAALIVTGFFAVLEPDRNFEYVQYAFLPIPLEATRVFIIAIKDKKYDVWIIAGGFILLFLFSSYDLLLDLNIMQPVHNITNGYPFGFVCLIVASSIYLARDFAKVNKKIIDQEITNREMEIKQRFLLEEDARKSKELEEARSLQLAMLPQCSNKLNGLEVCFSMKTAAEVGGDYYDYIISKDGVITFAIGDATGHGMKAGIMVSVIKSLFQTQGHLQDIPAFFNTCSQTIKQMHLGNLYMALMLIQVEGNRLTVSSAGMPPVFIYRKHTKSIEEFLIKGMPLGAVPSFDYKSIQTRLDPGDTVLLMSDGFPELFNNQDEMLDYHRVKEIFLEAAEQSPNDLINHLFNAGNNWLNGRDQHDDMTFIAFRYPMQPTKIADGLPAMRT